MDMRLKGRSLAAIGKIISGCLIEVMGAKRFSRHMYWVQAFRIEAMATYLSLRYSFRLRSGEWVCIVKDLVTTSDTCALGIAAEGGVQRLRRNLPHVLL